MGNVLVCHSWSTDLLDVDLIKENDLDGSQIWKLFFFIPVWFMSYFHLLSLVNYKQYGEGEMSRVVVFVNVLVFNFSLTIFFIKVCWEWSTIASLVHTLPLSTFPHSSYLVVLSEFFYILDWSLLNARLTVDLHTALSSRVWQWKCDQDRCFVKTNTVLHWIRKQIYFIRRR